MFFFPFRTDAPIYYWPVATIGLVVLNVAIYFAMINGQLQSPEEWLLWYGQDLHAEQWLSSMFLHASFDHLLGNMLFLWVFGLVVEGKLGWWKFLAVYLAIGVAQSMVEQTIMLGYAGEAPGSLGASAAIFGVLAMAVVWAPKNNVTFAYWVFVRLGTFDVTILALATFYIGLEIVFLLISGGTHGSGWLHLGGFAIGLPIGIVLLKHKVVDCEGWDVLHVWRGDYGSFREESDPLARTAEPPAPRQTERQAQQQGDAKQQLRAYLGEGNVAAAVLLYNKMQDLGGGFVLARDDFVAIIRGLHAKGRWTDSAPFMAELNERFPDGADPVRVKLAQICVVELERPGKALDLLAAVDVAKSPEKQATLARRVAAKARQMQAEGTVELDTDAW